MTTTETLSPEQAFKKYQEKFMTIPDDTVDYCKMPLEDAVAEAAQLSVVAVEDKEALVAAGIAAHFIDTLGDRAQAFAYAAAKYQAVFQTDPQAGREWKTLSPKGYELQRELTRLFAFVFRKDADLSHSVKKIKKGRGNRDMILDLLALSVLGNDNLEQLSNIPMFDKAQLDEAKMLHTRLSNLYARATIDPKKIDNAKLALNRAYTYYKEAADEIKDAGRFLFEGTDRYDSYVSRFRSEASKAGHRTKLAQTAAASE